MKKLRTITALIAGSLFSLALFIAPAHAQKAPKLLDTEVASVAVVANQIDIDFAKIAKEKSKSTEVLKFADMMAKDHQSVIDKASALVGKLKVIPKDNATSRNLVADATKTKTMLRTKTGPTFDKAYIDNEVAYHKAVISTVNTVLIPETENADLKKLLQDVVPVLKAHLQHAEMVQKKFSSK
jgi:putative membrane protein